MRFNPVTDDENQKDESLVDRVRKWLDGQGYPLEMLAARESRRYGAADVQVGQFYTDPETDTPREVDVIATCSAVGQGVQRPCHSSSNATCRTAAV